MDTPALPEQSTCINGWKEHRFQVFTMHESGAHPAIINTHLYATCTRCLATYALEKGHWQRIAHTIERT